MGVWIETAQETQILLDAESHPTWVCGLKHISFGVRNRRQVVTPYVGVWIETKKLVF